MARVAALPSAARALFACACAERLMAAFRWFCDVTGSASFQLVREALDAAWSGDSGRAGSASEVTALLPGGEEGELFLSSAVAQNAVACVAYALEVRQAGAVQAAVWAARQLYEAADTVVQHGSALQAYVEDIDREPPVRLMVRGIYAALDAAGSASAGVLLAGAREDGRTFLGFVTGSPWPATFMASVGGRLHLIMDAANDLPLHDAEQVEGLIQAGERAVAFENLCTQIYEYEIRLPSGLRDTVASTGEQLGVASRYWERLEFGG